MPSELPKVQQMTSSRPASADKETGLKYHCVMQACRTIRRLLMMFMYKLC
jgi:hypothetical protein